MKQFILFAGLIGLLCVNLAQAEPSRLNVMLGISSTLTSVGANSDITSFGISTQKVKSDATGFEEPDADTQINLNFSPRIGFLPTSFLAVGMDVNLIASSFKEGGSDNTYSTSLLTIGPFIRAYIPSGPVCPFFEGGLGFGAIKTKNEYESEYSLIYDDDDYESNESIFSWSAGAGAAVMMGNKASLDVMMGYQSFTLKDPDDNPNNYRMVYGNFGVRVGLVVFIRPSL